MEKAGPAGAFGRRADIVVNSAYFSSGIACAGKTVMVGTGTWTGGTALHTQANMDIYVEGRSTIWSLLANLTTC